MDNFAKVNLLDMHCLNEGHENSKLVAFCVDKNCTFPNKFVCLECLFHFHEQHKLVKLKLIQDRININFANEISFSKEEQLLEMKLKDTEEMIIIEIEKIKTNILEIFNSKLNNFMSEITEKILDYHKSQKTETFDLSILTKKELRLLTKDEMDNFLNYIRNSINLNLIIQNSQLTQNSLNLNESSNFSTLSNPNLIENIQNKRKSPITELDKFNHNFKKYVQDVNNTLCEFLNSKFLVTPSNILFSDNLYFEWAEKTFANFGMFYSISNNKLTAAKTQNDGTITILRSKDKLNLNENYYIEFLIDCKKFGDCEVGFGKESVGPICWLRTPGAYGIMNVGIYENGKNTKKEIRLEDGDIIGFEIYLKNDKNNPNFCRTAKIFKNSKFVHEFRIEIEEIYIMTAIRKVGNSVTIKDFKTLN
jgi:hypothetical protein